MTVVISVENVSKFYKLGLIGGGTLRGDLQRSYARLRHQPDPLLKIGEADYGNRSGEYIWALRDVSFQVEQGEVLGIIGRNGAGKSTLLKILSRVTAPTSGHIRLRGRIASLLEVGTGFHPELTGRENIYLNGSILGMKRKEIAHKFDEIVEFAEISQFIDTPVKRYSSGMYVRLAFAVAAHLEPEILLVDEVLAVGDAAFQKKCLGKMGEVARVGRTVLFVSHNMASISALCVRGILLTNGKKVVDDRINHTIQAYMDVSRDLTERILRDREDRQGDGRIRFVDAWIENDKGERTNIVQTGQSISVVAQFEGNHKKVNNPYIAFAIRASNGMWLTDLWNQGAGFIWDELPSTGKVKCTIPAFPFNEGDYYFTVCCNSNNSIVDYVIDAGTFHVEVGDYFRTGKLPYKQFSPILINGQEWKLEDF
jgi:lipopolysaccharide transport system ATP-binding protein